MELINWKSIGKYVKNKERIDILHFLYNQCKMHH